MTSAQKVRNEKLLLALDLSPLTYEQLCQVAKISEATLYRLINGEHKPRKKTVRSLCKLLQSQPENLGLSYE